MRKIVHLHKRRNGLEVEAFHSALVQVAGDMPQIPKLGTYVQSHTLVKGYRKGELLFDAVEEFAFHDEAAAHAFLASDAIDGLRERRAALVDGARGLAMRVDVHRVKDAAVPAGAVKNIEFVNRRTGMGLAEFRRYWRDVHGPIGSRIPSILRYEQNHVALDCYESGEEQVFDGLAITWFESTAAMREGAGSEAYEVTRADETNFLPDGHLPIIITREVLFR